MIAGDVRTLARDYCVKGTKVYYEQYARWATSRAS